MFEVIASSGHAGTMWLATVLDQGTPATWTHHLREAVTGLPWERLDEKYPSHRVFSQYWKTVREYLALGDFGDSNSWPPHLLLHVNRMQPIERVIYLTRNGVQQLHSLSTASSALRRWPPAAQAKFEALYYIAPTMWEKGIADFTHWEKLCLLVAANHFMPQWLRDEGLSVETYSLEELTTGVELSWLAIQLNAEQLAEWQSRDINRKVEGGRAESTIWRRWSSEQRQAFKDIVGRFTDDTP